jgi:hypothetical protein
MKTSLPIFRHTSVAILFLAFTLTLISCSKDIPETNIGQVIDFSIVAGFKNQLTKANTLDELPDEVKGAANVITTVLNPEEIILYSQANLDAEVTALKNALNLSEREMNGLKANEPSIYKAVIGRLTGIVSFARESDMERHHAAMLANPLFSAFMAGKPTQGETIYEHSDYQAILDLQKVLDAYTVQMMQKVQVLKKNTVKSAIIPPTGTVSEYDREVATLVALILDQAYSILKPYRAKSAR